MKTLFAIATLAIGAAVCTPLVMATPQSTCSGDKAAPVAQTSGSSCSSAKSVATTSGCPSTTAIKSLVKALYEMDQADGAIAARNDVQLALAALVEANPQVAAKISKDCNQSASVIRLVSKSSCSSAPAVAATSVAASSCSSSTAPSCSTAKAGLAKNASQCSGSGANLTAAAGSCSSQKGTANAALVANPDAGCKSRKGAANAAPVANPDAGCKSKKGAANAALVANPDAGCKSKKGAANAALVANPDAGCKSKKGAANAALVANPDAGCKSKKGAVNAALASNAGAACDSQKSGCGSKQKGASASFVAFDCCKSDAVARAAAEGYLEVLCAMKKSSGAEGCPMDVAKKTLAAVISGMSVERTAKAHATSDVQTVSLGAKVDPNCSAECQELCKKLGVDCAPKTAKN